MHECSIFECTCMMVCTYSHGDGMYMCVQGDIISDGEHEGSIGILPSMQCYPQWVKDSSKCDHTLICDVGQSSKESALQCL